MSSKTNILNSNSNDNSNNNKNCETLEKINKAIKYNGFILLGLIILVVLFAAFKLNVIAWPLIGLGTISLLIEISLAITMFAMEKQNNC